MVIYNDMNNDKKEEVNINRSRRRNKTMKPHTKYITWCVTIVAMSLI